MPLEIKPLAVEIKKLKLIISLLQSALLDDKGQIPDKTTLEHRLKEIEQELYIISDDVEKIEGMSKAELAWRRALPLIVTTLISVVTALVISRFEQTIAQFALLYSFAPLVSAVSGNFGLQSAAIIIRAIAVKGEQGLWRSVLKETAVGLMVGFMVGCFAGAIAFLLTGRWVAFPVLVVSLWAGMTTAGLMGTILPIIFKKLGFDPALLAGPGETTLQDLASYTTFLTCVTVCRELGWL